GGSPCGRTRPARGRPLSSREASCLLRVGGMCVEGLSAEQGLWQARDQVQLRGGTELSTDQRRALDHRSELRPGYLDGQVPQAAVRIDDQPVGRYDVERPADPTGDNLRRFELVALHVDDPEPDLPVPSVF